MLKARQTNVSSWRAPAFLVLLPISLIFAVPATADIVVITNQTDDDISFSISDESTFEDVRLAPKQSQPFSTTGAAHILLGNTRAAVGKEFPSYKLRPNGAYKLKLSNSKLMVQRINLGGNEFTLKTNPELPQRRPRIIPVSLWVDEEQRLAQRLWEPRFRNRFAKAAEIVRQHSGVEFKVVRIGEWRSSNRVRLFSSSLFEFVDVVDPGETLAIGFTAQYSNFDRKADKRIAGTRKPLDQHILVREWSGGVSEAERVELLVHELGHFLGAGHSNSPDSVMRPKLADGAAQTPEHRIRFDAANTLLMSLVGEELGGSGIPQLDHLTPQTRMRLRQIYARLATNSPADPVHAKYLDLLR